MTSSMTPPVADPPRPSSASMPLGRRPPPVMSPTPTWITLGENLATANGTRDDGHRNGIDKRPPEEKKKSIHDPTRILQGDYLPRGLRTPFSAPASAAPGRELHNNSHGYSADTIRRMPNLLHRRRRRPAMAAGITRQGFVSYSQAIVVVVVAYNVVADRITMTTLIRAGEISHRKKKKAKNFFPLFFCRPFILP